jgi:GNAT superfamily N-acetyltransferase
LEGKRIGIVGAYRAFDRPAADALLAAAAKMLAEEGCDLAVGPMNGDTWHSYRFVTERGVAPPFLMEPWNPPEWPEDFTRAGFAPLATYFSAWNPDLSRRDSRTGRIRERLEAAGVSIRSFRIDAYEGELARIFSVSLEAFPANFLYTPISRESFFALYRPFQPLVHPRLVLIAEAAGEPVGYVFAMPNGRQGSDSPPPEIVVKTIAVRPGRKFAGLGAWLLDAVQEAAHGMGFQSAIHALMHESNHSLNLSGRSATIMRRYTLYSRRLG